MNERNQYENNFMKNIKISIDNAESEINKQVLEYDNISSKSSIMLASESKEIVVTDEKIKQVERNLLNLKDQLTRIKLEIKKCILIAEIDGSVNLKQKISEGDYLSGGTLIANIIPKESQIYKVQISMPEKEIAGIHVGDEVKLQFHALPYREYGSLSGRVTKLSTDSSFDEKQGVNFFIVEADVENKPLYSYKGKKSTLKVGMSCDALVIIKSKRVLSLVLEKIDLWD